MPRVGIVKGPGLKPPQTGLFRREIIGPAECPILVRWTLASTPWGKLLLHHFQPDSFDGVEHDHPASFLTIVLAGGYDDHVPCGGCDGRGYEIASRLYGVSIRDCACGDGSVVGDRMRPGMVRFRRAEHRHRTRVGPDGCWTLVFMGRKRREWGFWKNAIWMPWREHERLFGFAMRCPEEHQS